MRRSSQSRKVKVSEFKVHLGRYLKEVKSGNEITVLDRETPVAKLIPFVEEPSLEIIPPSLNWAETDAAWKEKTKDKSATVLKKSSLDYLSEDRDSK